MKDPNKLNFILHTYHNPADISTKTRNKNASQRMECVRVTTALAATCWSD